MVNNHTIGGTLKYTCDRVRCIADGNLKKYDLTLSQVRILRFIQLNGGECSQKQIEDFLRVSHPTVVGLVCRLEQNGFITSNISSKDRRNKIIKSTQKAKDVSLQLRSQMDRTDEKMLKDFSDEEKETFLSFLKRIIDNLNEGKDVAEEYNCKCCQTKEK